MFETDFPSSAYYRGEKRTNWLKEFCVFKVDVLTKTRVFAVCKEYGIKGVAYIERIKVNEINFNKMSDRFFQRLSYMMGKVHSYV